MTFKSMSRVNALHNIRLAIKLAILQLKDDCDLYIINIQHAKTSFSTYIYLGDRTNARLFYIRLSDHKRFNATNTLSLFVFDTLDKLSHEIASVIKSGKYVLNLTPKTVRKMHRIENELANNITLVGSSVIDVTNNVMIHNVELSSLYALGLSFGFYVPKADDVGVMYKSSVLNKLVKHADKMSESKYVTFTAKRRLATVLYQNRELVTNVGGLNGQQQFQYGDLILCLDKETSKFFVAKLINVQVMPANIVKAISMTQFVRNISRGK